MDVTGHFRGQYLNILIDQLEKQNIPYKNSKHYSSFFETCAKNPEARIPTEITFKWLDDLIDRYHLVLPVHIWFDTPDLQPIPLIDEHTSSLEEAIALLQRNINTIGSEVVFEIKSSPADVVEFEIYRPPHFLTPELSYVIGEWLVLTIIHRIVSLYVDIEPLEMCFKGKECINDPILAKLPNTQFRFEQSRIYLSYDNRALNFSLSEQESDGLKKPSTWSLRAFIRDIALEHLAHKRFNRETLAHALGISSRHFQRKLSEEADAKFRDYLGEIKIEMAKNLLKNASQSVSEVSRKLGYSSASHFIRAFKKGTGVTPREYLLKCRNKIRS